ncbi:helix-turn-helix transcriptional regulator [Virgibacillus dokdonensis]|uniref:helix-turn-helix transcriptional regulator n=1 Tax=Virgibacillus dokdonensis TaxID=302167 RepID=UPI00098B3696|nr:helix-turn-helix transcriptional regulator [Virgibacillus dokdonensis]
MERKAFTQLRKKHQLTQQELAKELGISTIYVRKIEKGDADPGRDTMVKYELFFNEDIKKLFPDIFYAIDKEKQNDKEVI